jgi:hypothetical protein
MEEMTSLDINKKLHILLEKVTELGTKIEKLEIPQESPNEEVSRSEDLKDLFTALAKAQAEMLTAGLDADNPYFKSKYADFTSIVRASRPALTKHGLAVLQQLLPDDGSLVLHTMLTHTSGQWIASRMKVLPPKNDIQTLGSHITYLKRYSYSSLVGVVVSNEDDDGEAAVSTHRDLYAKGPSQFNRRNESFDTVTKEQLEEIEYEYKDRPDIAKEVLEKLGITTFADLPKTKYKGVCEHIRKIRGLTESK